jgi:hypothetical protein
MLDLVSVASPFFPFALPAMVGARLVVVNARSTDLIFLKRARKTHFFEKGAEIQLRFIPMMLDKALYTALEPCSP